MSATADQDTNGDSDSIFLKSMQPVGQLQRETIRQNDRDLDYGAGNLAGGQARAWEAQLDSIPISSSDPFIQAQTSFKRKRSVADTGKTQQPPHMRSFPSGEGSDETNDDDDDELYEMSPPAMDTDVPGEVARPAQHAALEPNGSIAPRENGKAASVASPSARTAESLLERTIVEAMGAPMALPANKVFPVQVGSKLFRLSGASISSDAPSYFTQFFQAQLKRGVDPAEIKTLYLDRDPETFRDISLHLQGYHVEPRDSTHFVKLFADAQFFSLPRLIQRLYKSDILVNIGDEEFRVSRDMFDNPGDSPNYFSLGFSVFFSTPDNVFPGLSRGGLLRPPSLHPPHIQTRSSAIFRDILHVLRGYELHIKDDEHRQALLRDARYYHLRGLEQKLVPHHKVYNASRKQEEMIMRLSDLKSAGISLIVTAKSQGSSEDGNRMSDSYPPLLAQVEGNIAYARPFVDADPLNLVFELGATDMTLSCSFSGSSNIITLSPSARVRIMSLYKILRSKMIDLTGQDTVDTPQAPPEAVIERDAHVVVDGRTIDWSNVEPGENDLSKLWMASLVEPPEDAEIEARPQECWVVNKSQWRLRVSFAKETGPEMRVVWYAVKIDAVTSEAHWNAQRGFL